MDSIDLVKSILSKYYITREISNSDEFKEICKREVDLQKFNEVFNKLIDLEDGDFVGDLFYIGFILKFFNKDHEKHIKMLLNLNWHQKHEDIVDFFQKSFNNKQDNINILLLAIDNVPDYLSPDDFKYPYIRKIIYAIGAQPEPYNIEALKKLTKQTEDQEIKNLALHQIEKRKELGRWEFNENQESKS